MKHGCWGVDDVTSAWTYKEWFCKVQAPCAIKLTSHAPFWKRKKKNRTPSMRESRWKLVRIPSVHCVHISSHLPSAMTNSNTHRIVITGFLTVYGVVLDFVPLVVFLSQNEGLFWLMFDTGFKNGLPSLSCEKAFSSFWKAFRMYPLHRFSRPLIFQMC